jgi:hypothetical protein
MPCRTTGATPARVPCQEPRAQRGQAGLLATAVSHKHNHDNSPPASLKRQPRHASRVPKALGPGRRALVGTAQKRKRHPAWRPGRKHAPATAREHVTRERQKRRRGATATATTTTSPQITQMTQIGTTAETTHAPATAQEHGTRHYAVVRIHKLPPAGPSAGGSCQLPPRLPLGLPAACSCCSCAAAVLVPFVLLVANPVFSPAGAGTAGRLRGRGRGLAGSSRRAAGAGRLADGPAALVAGWFSRVAG